jgi:hypothetical protein
MILKFSKQIIAGTNFQLFLLCDFLDFGRLKYSSFKLNKEKFNIKDEVQEIIDLYSENCAAKNIFIVL